MQCCVDARAFTFAGLAALCASAPPTPGRPDVLRFWLWQRSLANAGGDAPASLPKVVLREVFKCAFTNAASARGY